MPLNHGSLPPGQDVGALLPPDPHVALDGLELGLRHDRPLVAGRIERGADPDGLGPLGELCDERVGDRPLDQQPGARRADLAVVEEHTPQRAVHRVVHVDVVEDDRRGLAAQLQRALLDVGGGQLHDPPPDLR